MSVETAPFGGKLGAHQLVTSLIDELKDSQIAIVVYLDKEDCTHTYWSDGSSLKRLGMLDIAKAYIRETFSV